MIQDACPDRIEGCRDDAAVELLLDAADPVWEKDADVVAWEVALRVKNVRL